MTEIARILATLGREPDQPAALATLVQVEGSSYRRPGARLLLLANGERFGSISGGCLEEDILLRAQRVLETGRPERAVYDTTAENDLVWGVGLGCQGVVRILIEPLPAARPRWIGTLAANLHARRDTALQVTFDGNGPLGTTLASHSAPHSSATVFRETISAPPALVIFGAGDDAQPLVRLAKETGWHVTVTDARAHHATHARFPEADAVIIAPAGQLPDVFAVTGPVFAVVLTHRYADDLEILRALLPGSPAYLGLLGPRKRTDRLLAQLRTEGITPDATTLARLHAPVGLDLGGTTPETVALAIVAELQARLIGRAPGFLRDRPGSIHA